ncbi:MAG TPA: diacylglycerol kinase family protein [Flavobacterium sp.]|jgi:YegS/Rv2252/BmrU family lipid kinase
MKGKKRIMMVVNPISGDIDKADFTAAAEARAALEGFDFILYETTGNNDKEQIKLLYEEQQPEKVLVAGGDGTIKLVAESLEEHDVILGILPAGSANGLSVDLNLPPALEDNLEIAFNDNHTELDMICINGHRSLHLSDIGLNAELIRNYENSSIRGKLGYAIQSVTTLADAKVPFRAVIKTENASLETEATMIVIANSQKYGTGVTINPVGVMDDGKFEIVILRNLDLLVFGKIIIGNMPLDSDDIEIISCETATITTNVEVHFQVDGEYIGEVTELDIRILPRQMKVAVPDA